MDTLWRKYEYRRTQFNEELTGRGEAPQEQSALDEIYAFEDFAIRNYRAAVFGNGREREDLE